MMKTAQKLFRFLEIGVSASASALVAFLLFALLPLPGNYKLLVVQSGSMQPTIPVGSLVLVSPRYTYAPGDIVTFTPSVKEPNKFVTHRISRFSPDTFGLVFQTKGDANKTPDPADLPVEHIVGKVLLSLPFVGLIFHNIKTPLGFIAVVIVPATILIYEELKKVYLTIRDSAKGAFIKKQKLTFTSDDHRLLQSISELKQKESIRFDGKLLMFFLMVGTGLVFAGITHSFFSDIETGSVTLAAAVGSPLPSTFPSVSPSPVPPHIVINEVFYHADPGHGGDDHHGGCCGGDDEIDVTENGEGSTNTVDVTNKNKCKETQDNQTNDSIDFNVNGNSGSNTNSENSGGTAGTTTGNVTNSGGVNVTGGENEGEGCSDPGNKDEWVELYNPTNETVNLKNWTLTDDSGNAVTITGNHNLGAHKFALISRDNSTWTHWSVPVGVLKIPLGQEIGDGLGGTGDHLLLRNSIGTIIDAMSYGSDTNQFNLPGVAAGHSLERDPDGFDTDTVGDWLDRTNPSPGS